MDTFFDYINKLMHDEKTKKQHLNKEDFGQYFYNEHFKKNNIRFPRLKFQQFMDNLFPKVVIETVENITLETYNNMINQTYFYSKYLKNKIYQDNEIKYNFDYSKMPYSLQYYTNFNYYNLESEQNYNKKKRNDDKKINYKEIKNEFYNTDTTLLSNDEGENRHTKSYIEYINFNVYTTILNYIKEDNDNDNDKKIAMHKYIYEEIFSKYHFKHNNLNHHKNIHLGIPLLGRFITNDLYKSPVHETNSQLEKTKTQGGKINNKKKQKKILYYNIHHYSDIVYQQSQSQSPSNLHFLLNFLLDHDSIIIINNEQKINFELFLIFLCYLKINNIINTKNIKNIFDSNQIIISKFKKLLKEEILNFYNTKIFEKLPSRLSSLSDNLYSKLKLDEDNKFDYILFILFIIFYVFFNKKNKEFTFQTIMNNKLKMNVEKIKLLNLLFPVKNNEDSNSTFTFIIDEIANINRRLLQSKDLIFNIDKKKRT